MGQSPGSDVEATRENLAHASPQTLKLGPRRRGASPGTTRRVPEGGPGPATRRATRRDASPERSANARARRYARTRGRRAVPGCRPAVPATANRRPPRIRGKSAARRSNRYPARRARGARANARRIWTRRLRGPRTFQSTSTRVESSELPPDMYNRRVPSRVRGGMRRLAVPRDSERMTRLIGFSRRRAFGGKSEHLDALSLSTNRRHSDARHDARATSPRAPARSDARERPRLARDRPSASPRAVRRVRRARVLLRRRQRQIVRFDGAWLGRDRHRPRA